MKNIIILLGLFLSSLIFAAEDEVKTRLVIGGDPSAGVLHTMCVEGYKFALYRNLRTVTNAEGYAGESQSSSLVQIIDDRGRGIKCSK